MEIVEGYEPLDKLDVNIIASKNNLAKLGFPISEINKLDSIAKAREHFIKRSKELSKSKKVNETSFEPPMCDICGNKYLSVIKLISPEQEKRIPLDWKPYALKRFPEPGDYRAHIVLPLGMVLDFGNRKIYIICGNCRMLLGLKSTYSGILFHTKVVGKGYGFVNFDKIEKLNKVYKEQILKGNYIDPILDFDIALRGLYIQEA